MEKVVEEAGVLDRRSRGIMEHKTLGYTRREMYIF